MDFDGGEAWSQDAVNGLYQVHWKAVHEFLLEYWYWGREVSSERKLASLYHLEDLPGEKNGSCMSTSTYLSAGESAGVHGVPSRCADAKFRVIRDKV